MKKVTTVSSSSAKTASGTSSTASVGRGDVSVLLDVTAVSGTTPALDVSVQWSHDGATFFTADPGDAFTQLTAAAKKVKTFPPRAPFFRLSWAVAGTTPSFTFAAMAYTS